MSAFKDHFSTASADYAVYRPTYPPALVDFLAEASPANALALDCGCGNGQLSVLLAARFARVIGADASATQIEKAEPHSRVEYRVASAEASGLADGSANLVVAAQAAHWFDLPAFYDEARRVACEHGIVALVTYGVIEMEEPVHAYLRHIYREVVGPHWPAERRHVEEGYRSLDFPFEEFAAPPRSRSRGAFPSSPATSRPGPPCGPPRRRSATSRSTASGGNLQRCGASRSCGDRYSSRSP